VEGIAEADDGRSDGRLLGPVRDVIDEGSIDLEDIDREMPEISEYGCLGRWRRTRVDVEDDDLAEAHPVCLETVAAGGT
jgi:hypothetical protein